MERILVVDDEPDIVRMVSRFLIRQGYEIATAADGEDALAQLQKHAFGLIVTDITMPKMDGLALVNAAKMRDPDLEVVILTGAGVLAHAIAALRAGAYDFLLKPLERIEALGEVVQRALERRRLRLENQRLVGALSEANQHLEEKVAERTAELEDANRHLASALQVKTEFLANMSHELRTPLNAILGFAELLREGAFGSLTEKQARFVSNIRRGGQHLLALITNLLDLSAVEAGRVTLHPQPIDLSELLATVQSDLQPQADEKAVVLDLQVEADLPWLTADPVRLKQIFLNLLDNAVKFTPKTGRVTMTVRQMTKDRRQETGSVPRPSFPVPWLEIGVTDTGIGVSAEDLPKLFQPLTQLEPAHTKRYPGTGLGLALTKRLVELHTGRIWAESPGPGLGSTFWIQLPLAQAGDARGEVPSSEGSSPIGTDTQK